MARGGDGFRQGVAGIGFVKKRLALKIRQLDEIAVNDSEPANSGTHEQICRDRAERPAADKNSAGLEEALLAFFTDGGKQNLARVFLELSGVHDSLE